jgi:hypothetical protein
MDKCRDEAIRTEAATVLILGVAIMNRESKGIGNSIQEVYETWKVPSISRPSIDPHCQSPFHCIVASSPWI